MGAKRHVDDSRRQSVCRGQGADAAGLGIELVDTPAVAEIDEAPAVFRHAQDAVARQALKPV